jgi:hypothetical protein
MPNQREKRTPRPRRLTLSLNSVRAAICEPRSVSWPFRCQMRGRLLARLSPADYERLLGSLGRITRCRHVANRRQILADVVFTNPIGTHPWQQVPRKSQGLSETLRRDELGARRETPNAGAFSIERFEVSRFATTALCVLNCGGGCTDTSPLPKVTVGIRYHPTHIRDISPAVSRSLFLVTWAPCFARPAVSARTACMRVQLGPSIPLDGFSQ